MTRQQGKEHERYAPSSPTMVYRPTDRERQRYLTYTGTNPLPTFHKLFGEYGVAQAGIQHLQPGLIRVNATHIDHSKAAICLTPGCQSLTVTSSLTKARA